MKKILSLILLVTFLVSGSNLALVTSFANESDILGISDAPKINVWLIAGQSNADGYGEWANYPTDSTYASDKAFLEAGAKNVLYMGMNDSSFSNVKPKATRTGAEIGIATSDVGRNEMNAVIKVAMGNTYLYNDTIYDNSKKYGTWTPPTYIKNHNIDTSQNMVGKLYNTFLSKVEYGISSLVKLGYQPEIKGIWYMQGEAETLNSSVHGKKPSDAYEELLTTLIGDLRADITKITGADYSDLPFVYGRIYRNPGIDPSTGNLYSAATPYISNIQAAQDAVVAKNIKNVRMINTTTDLVDPVTGVAYTPVQQDGWHYNSLTQQAIGEKIVEVIENMNYTPEAIKTSLLSYMVSSKQHINDDGYIGIPVEISTYYDQSKGNIKSGHNGTPVIVYVVNTNTTRVGTDSDESIILSMLSRGYVVVVIDYLNNEKATGQSLDWSVQGLRAKVKDKTFLTDSIFPTGTYYDNYVVPAGYNVSLNNVYWEMDKHASDGTFDWIVNNWNTDFRGIKGSTLVKWVRPDGTRKKTLSKASDGTSVTWYNASGAEDVNGQYTKVKYTVAEKITDCVKPDGSPIDLNQSMSFIYPTNPIKKVPVYSMASSSEYLAATPQVADRPHFNGFLFRGYAGVVFEYGYIPMARDDSYGVYNGSKSTHSSAVSDDSDNYGVHMYDDKRINTAAMRYIRYKALSEPDIYKFDIDHIGIVGNSKGGAMSFVGEKIVQEALVSNPSSYATTKDLELAIDTKINSIISRRGHAGHHNETRFQNGDTQTYTEDGVTIDGGEIQPWLTYNGVEIESGAQLVWASNGVSGEDISEGHSPQIVMCHEQDPWHYYGPLNEFANSCRSHDIPMLHFEVPLGHTVAYGKDLNYDIDVYDASFDFIDYYLKGSPVKVLYTNPQDKAANIGVTSPILIKFSGGVSSEEVNKITLSANGNNVTGTWKSSYGNTYWEFTPDVLEGNTKYTLTVPSYLKGENGVEMGTPYTATLYSEYGENVSVNSSSDITGGKSVTVTVPELSDDANEIKVRFRVTNDGANIVSVYTENGALIGKVNIKGQGYYEVDATDYLADKAGQQVTLLLKEEKTQGIINTYTSDFTNNMDKCSVAEMTEVSLATAPDLTPSLKIVKTDSGSKYNQHVIYNSSRMPAVTVSNILGFKITEDDYGRKFTFKVRLYDTISRVVQLKLNTNTNSGQEVADYDNPMYNFTTKANEWMTYEFDYAVYDTDYGKIGLKNKNLIISVSHAGDTHAPLYISEIDVDETVTGISMDNISVALGNNGGGAYKLPEDNSIFAIYNGETKVAGYNTLNEALGAYKYGYTVKLAKNYTLKDSDLYGDYALNSGAKGENGHIFDIDLNGYTINCENTKNSLLWLKSTSLANGKTVINLKNGTVNLKNTALISYESSNASGNGKEYDINLLNLNIGILDNANMDSIVSATTIPSGAGANVNVTLDECNINLPGDKLTPEYKTIIPSGGDGLNIFYNMKGGSINLSSQRWIKIHDKLENSTFIKGKNNKYTVLNMPSCALVSSAAYMLDGELAASYELKSTENNMSSYELAVTTISTRYGVIPEEYVDVDKYPIVWFDEAGNFKGSADTLCGNSSSTSAIGLAKTYLADNKYNTTTKSYGANPLKAFIVLRKDYTMGSSETYGNLAQVQGVLTIDLNGNTLYQNGKPLVDGLAKRWGSSGDVAVFPTEVAIINGTVAIKNNSLVQFAAWDANASGDVANKEFTHTYSNVTFKLQQGATATNFFTVGKNASTPTATAKTYVNINDCKFDFETVAPTSNITIFDVNSEYINFNGNITGSEVYASSMEKIKISKVGGKSVVEASKNADGEYLKVYVKKENKSTFKDEALTISKKAANFIENGTLDSYAVFALEEPSVPVITKVTANKYVNLGTSEARNYELQNIDVTKDVTDGAIATNNASIDYINKTNVDKWDTLDATTNANQHWLIELDKVHTLGSMDVVYTGTHKWIKFNVQVSNDNETWTDLGTITPDIAAAKDDPVTISLKSKQGKYIKIAVVERQSTNDNYPNAVWGANLNAGASVVLYEILSISNEDKVDDSIKTKYGTIPSDYASVDSYPFVLFDEAGNFKGASDILYGLNNETSIMGQAKAYLKANVYDTAAKSYGSNEKKAFILLRKDYTMAGTERYGNMAQIQGTVTIDMDGHTIKTSSAWPLVYSQIKPWSTAGDAALFPTELKFVNGLVVLNNKGLGNYETWTSASDTTTDLTLKTFTHTYENVTFTLASGTSLASLFSITDKTHDALGYANFIDCKFDFETVAPTSAITLFKATASKIKMHYNIKGSEIYAPTMENITLSNVASGSSVTFDKNESGKYIKVYVENANKDSFKDVKVNTPDGEQAFAQWEQSGEYAVFSIGEEGSEPDEPSVPSEPDQPIVTKYGTIPAEYKDADKYPVVWFDEAGNFKGASSELFGVSNSTTSPVHLAKTYLKGNVYDAATESYGTNEKKAYILLRKDYKMASNEAYGSITQAQGVLTIDLNGFTLIQNSKPIVTGKAIRWSGSGDAAVFPTEVVFENGTILLKDNGLVAFSAWYASNNDDVKNKKFLFTYNDVTVKLAEGATVKQLFNFAQDANTPTAVATMNVNMNNCKLDLESVEPQNGFTLFNANGDYIKVNYNITGSEIYATSMENIVISSDIKEGSSITVNKNSEDEYLKVFVAKENKDSFEKVQMNTPDGEAQYEETASDDKYAIYTLKLKPSYLPGDINGDGIVNTKDITTLRRYNSGGYDNLKVVEEALDVNKDGIINTKDITILRRYNSGGYGIELK